MDHYFKIKIADSDNNDYSKLKAKDLKIILMEPMTEENEFKGKKVNVSIQFEFTENSKKILEEYSNDVLKNIL